jgi:hypothetical protein
MLHRHHFLLLLLLSIIFAPPLYLYRDKILSVFASSPTILGWAWSSNIGWISLNSGNPEASSGSPYGLTVVGDGIYGYAWSSNIGYIYFGGSDSSVGRININERPDRTWAELTNTEKSGDVSTSTVSGWARACSVFVTGCSGPLRPSHENGGWDGWISLSGSNYKVELVQNDKQDTSPEIVGYAWGGGAPAENSPQFVGWIGFNVETETFGLDFNKPGTDAMLVIFDENLESPKQAFKSRTLNVIPKVTLESTTPQPCTSDIVLGVVRIYDKFKPETIIPEGNWKILNQSPIFSRTLNLFEGISDANLQLKLIRRTAVGSPIIKTGVYVVEVSATPTPQNTCGGVQTTKIDLVVDTTASSHFQD